MARKLFLNLPVANLARSVDFFSSLGFSFEPGLADDRAAALVVSRDALVMLLVQDLFTTFTGQPLPATREVVIALSAESREEIDAVVGRALEAGGSRAQDPKQDGPMYGWSFLDPDGHQWELMAVGPGHS